MFVRDPGLPTKESSTEEAFTTATSLTESLLELHRSFPSECAVRTAQIRGLLRKRAGLIGNPARNLAAALNKMLGHYYQRNKENMLLEGVALMFAAYAEKYIRRAKLLQEVEKQSSPWGQSIKSRMKIQRDNIVTEVRALYESGCAEMSRCVADMHPLVDRMIANLRRSCPQFEAEQIAMAARLFHDLHAQAQAHTQARATVPEDAAA